MLSVLYLSEKVVEDVEKVGNGRYEIKEEHLLSYFLIRWLKVSEALFKKMNAYTDPIKRM